MYFTVAGAFPCVDPGGHNYSAVEWATSQSNGPPPVSDLPNCTKEIVLTPALAVGEPVEGGRLFGSTSLGPTGSAVHRTRRSRKNNAGRHLKGRQVYVRAHPTTATCGSSLPTPQASQVLSVFIFEAWTDAAPKVSKKSV